MRRVAFAALLAIGCDRPPADPKPPEPSAATADHSAGDPGATTTAPATPDWSFLGPRDETQAAALRQEQRLLAPYLQAESPDGELKVEEADVQGLLDYAGPLLEQHAGKADASMLASDGQRYLQAAWLLRHAELAAQHRASLVRIPITACIGWGCEVPSQYVAADCFGPVAFFVIPKGVPLTACEQCLGTEDDEARMECMSRDCDALAEGWFTGHRERVESEEAGCGAAWEFQVLRLVDATEPAYDLLVAAGEPPP